MIRLLAHARERAHNYRWRDYGWLLTWAARNGHHPRPWESPRQFEDRMHAVIDFSVTVREIRQGMERRT